MNFLVLSMRFKHTAYWDRVDTERAASAMNQATAQHLMPKIEEMTAGLRYPVGLQDVCAVESPHWYCVFSLTIYPGIPLFLSSHLVSIRWWHDSLLQCA